MMWLDMNRIFFRVDFLLFGAQYSGYVHASAGEKYPRRGCNGGNVQAPVRISGFDNEWAEIIGPDLGPSDTHVMASVRAGRRGKALGRNPWAPERYE